jgi:putative membrane protein
VERGVLLHLGMKLSTLILTTLFVATPAFAQKSTLSDDDREFLEDAHASNIAEIRLSELALKITTNDEVKKLATKMIADHTAASEELKKLAAKKRFVPSPKIEDSQLRREEKMRNMSGSKFDDEYLATMDSDHRNAITVFGDAADDADDAEIKKFAASTLPTLHHHLGMVEAAQKAVKGSKKS